MMKKESETSGFLNLLGSRSFLAIGRQALWAVAMMVSVAPAMASAEVANAPAKLATSGAKAGATGESTIKETAPRIAAVSRFGLIAGFEANRSLHASGDHDLSGDMSLMLNPTFKLNNSYLLGAIGALSKDLYGENRDDIALANTQIFLARTPVEFGLIKIGGSLFSTLATNKTAFEKETLRGSAGLGLKMLFDFEEKAPVSGFLSFKGERYFHEFTTNADGQLNIENKLTQSLNMALALGEQVSLSVQGDMIEAWTYRDTIKNSFGLSEELSLSMSKSLRVYIGHSNSGNSYKYDGRESNVEFFNANTSLARAGMTLTY